jgi:NAD-dependent SIR2 family protein deacetylase
VQARLRGKFQLYRCCQCGIDKQPDDYAETSYETDSPRLVESKACEECKSAPSVFFTVSPY